MANPDLPRGFTKPRHLTAVGAQTLVTLTNDGTTAIGNGDPVMASDTVQGSYQRALAANDVITHVAQEYSAATVGAKFKALPVSDYSFEAQFDDNTVTDVQAVIGLTYGLIWAAPDATFGNSTMEIDGSGVAASDCTILEAVERPDNDDALANNKVRVLLNNP